MVSFKNEKTFRNFNIVFTIAGVPLYNRPNTLAYTIYALFVFFCSFTTVIGILMNLYVNFDDLDKVSDSINTLPPIVLSFWTNFYLRFRKENIVKLMKFTDCFTWEGLPARDPSTGNTSMTFWIQRLEKTGTRIAIFSVAFHSTRAIFRLFASSNDQRLLSYDSWYPYDWNKSPAYELTNISQIVASVVYTAFFIDFPPFYATLVVIACSQLEKLRSSLLNIKQNTNSSMAVQGQFETSEEVFSRMQKELNECIQLHQKIIRFLTEMEETFSTLFVGSFLIIMLSLCFSTFSAVLRWGNIVNMMQSVTAYVMCLILIFLFCWFASELVDQGDRVRDAAWDCDWVGTPVSFQRSLVFVIACANKEFKLTAGKCVPVTKQTMMNMIQESISLFMFLLQVRDQENNEK